MHWIIHASDVFSASTGNPGQIRWTDFVSIMTWFGLVYGSATPVRYYPSTLATFVMPTQGKTILELFRPAFGVLPKTGDAEPVDRGKPG